MISSEIDEIGGFPKNKEWEFTGWTADDAVSASDPEFSHTQKYTHFSDDGENITLYACFSAIEYSVTLNPNGGILKGEEEAQKAVVKKITFTDELDLGEDSVTRPGYDFGGWYSDTKFTKPVTSADDLINAGGSIKTLYAKWGKE